MICPQTNAIRLIRIVILHFHLLRLLLLLLHHDVLFVVAGERIGARLNIAFRLLLVRIVNVVVVVLLLNNLKVRLPVRFLNILLLLGEVLVLASF